jgi:hypothetical protein
MENKGTPSPEQNQGKIFYLALFQLENNYGIMKTNPKLLEKIQWTNNY